MPKCGCQLGNKAQQREEKVQTWCREGELNPQGAKHRRILSTQLDSDPFGKFSTLLKFFNRLQPPHFDPACE